MKIYKNLWVVFALLIIGCSKSTDKDSEEVSSVDVDYTVLLEKGNLIESQALNANLLSISLDTTDSNFSAIEDTAIEFSEDNIQTFYRQTSDCKGEIVSYDFNNEVEDRFAVFADLLDCELTITAIARHDSFFYVAYEKTEATLQKEYKLRKIDNSSAEISFEEVVLTQKTIQIKISNNRVFVLALNEAITDENNLFVIDNSTFGIINDQGLGSNVKNIFKKQDGNLILSYEEFHTIVNVSTLALTYVQYEDSTSPKFHDSNQYNLDNQGNLYYSRSVDDSVVSVIPSIYNLDSNLASFYFYENFLREEQINIEFQIAETTVVAFDEENGLMLIGYRKIGSSELGGLLRVKPAPDLTLIDNIDLDGVPYNIFVK